LSIAEGLEDDNAVEDSVRQHCHGEGVIGKLVKCYPEALHKVDSRSGLFPFMMAVTHSDHSTDSVRLEGECDTLKHEAQLFSTGLVFDLLLESPGLLPQISQVNNKMPDATVESITPALGSLSSSNREKHGNSHTIDTVNKKSKY